LFSDFWFEIKITKNAVTESSLKWKLKLKSALFDGDIFKTVPYDFEPIVRSSPD